VKGRKDTPRAPPRPGSPSPCLQDLLRAHVVSYPPPASCVAETTVMRLTGEPLGGRPLLCRFSDAGHQGAWLDHLPTSETLHRERHRASPFRAHRGRCSVARQLPARRAALSWANRQRGCQRSANTSEIKPTLRAPFAPHQTSCRARSICAARPTLKGRSK
jgi:hypothetical protein